ncbi:MAG: cobaltochelatase subunit CobN, partial [Candidatus Methanospirareceae archaeon]
SSKECWPAILIQDLPVVYPYIMDNVGEGTQAKRRGNAVRGWQWRKLKQWTIRSLRSF